MNKVTRNSELTLPKVTTGRCRASQQGLFRARGFADLRVPLREIALDGEERRGAVPHL